ncbi:zinc-binding alcohol dehydrogenase family protein [Periweissella ghanensis]|uniref:Zinc-type alcohol dehydrogenase-like protein n=1 Tax=Periweissella ghanensis TaxID=467997 RepID=A0ABN8BR44_9LACO|nr:zinc-binding alcohol dehydrogenase family protein [Periweissella ghanensis]MCM0600380.1 zinc-binding alcohol dehydrogenase family protein [Periweissella ghanensis]CAH0419308.1 Zinc-type alcohol dehydrogenase-like protein [Periweissella ghanensis]
MNKQNLVIGAYEGLPIEDSRSLEYIELPMSEPVGHDVLVKIKAVSVNPVDTKLRQTLVKTTMPKIFGYDAVGEVVAVGQDVTKFKTGDRVFYAGDATRDGSNATYQIVREEIMALAPTTLSDAQAAAMPLTALTAYELLFEKLHLIPQPDAHDGETIFVINGAGGVGAVLIQLAKWIGMTVIATASRPETQAFVEKMGADYVVNHRGDYVSTVQALGFETVDNAVILNATAMHFTKVAELIAPFGQIGAIAASDELLPMNLLKNKSVSFNWEFMFAKTQYDYQIESQGEYLQQIAELLDTKVIQTTLTKELAGITLANLKLAHQMLEAGQMIGKLVLTEPVQ